MAIDFLQEPQDSTGGRGFADAGAPGHLTRISLRFADLMRLRLRAVSAEAERNRGFARVRLTPEERAVRIQDMPPERRETLQQLVGQRALADEDQLGEQALPEPATGEGLPAVELPADEPLGTL